jgi:PAS domain S-box-containing protein
MSEVRTAPAPDESGAGPRAAHEHARLRAEERYRLVTRATNDVIWDWDLATDELLWNEALETTFGYRPGQVEQRIEFWYDHVHPEDRDRVVRGIHAVIDSGGETWSDEYRFARADGSYAAVLDRGFIARGGDGRAVRMIGSMQEITARKAAEEKLRRSEERFRSLVGATTAIVWTTPASGERAGGQPEWGGFTGQTETEYRGWGWTAAVHPDDRAATAAAWARALDERMPYEVEHRVRRHDGEWRWMQARAVPVLEADGTVREWVGVHQDVTERRTAEEALARSEEDYRFLADTIPQLVWTTQPDGYHEYYNRRWYEYTGLSYEETKGAGWNAVLHPDDRDRAFARWRRSLETGEPYSIEYRFRRHDWCFRWFLGQALPMRDGDGTIVRWFGTCTDIDDQKRVEEERERAVEARSRFYAAMSHELRTPINAVLGYNDLILAEVYGPLAGPQRAGLERGQRAARHLLHLVNDVLDLSKLEAGKLEPVWEPVPIGALVRDLFATVTPLAEEHGTDLRLVEAGPSTPIVTDPRRVQQILLNLISNALKFGAGRPVEVRCGDRGDEVVVEVVDRGGGIAAGDLKRIFEEFVQLPNAREGGTGLGLPISKRLAELLGGSLEVESAPGEGSTFRLRLPRRASAPAGARTATEPADI